MRHLPWRDIVQVRLGLLKRKQERGQYPAIMTEQAWSKKDLLWGQKENQLIGS